MYGIEHVGMGLGGLSMILFWLLPPVIFAVLLIVLLWRHFPGDAGDPRHQSALEILEARYARGEIDRDTYLKRRADLEG